MPAAEYVPLPLALTLREKFVWLGALHDYAVGKQPAVERIEPPGSGNDWTPFLVLKVAIDLSADKIDGNDVRRLRAFLDDIKAVLRPIDISVPEQVPSEPEISTSKPPRQRRGRKKAEPEKVQREAELAARWKRAREIGGYKAVFARDNGMNPRDFDKLLDRVASRRRSE